MIGKLRGAASADRDAVLHVEEGDLLRAARRGAAQDRGPALDCVAERLAGERVVGQRHGDVGETRGRLAPVGGGIQADGLDVAQEGETLVEPSAGADDLIRLRGQFLEKLRLRESREGRLGARPGGVDPLDLVVAVRLVSRLGVEEEDLYRGQGFAPCPPARPPRRRAFAAVTGGGILRALEEQWRRLFGAWLMFCDKVMTKVEPRQRTLDPLRVEEASPGRRARSPWSGTLARPACPCASR